MGIAKTCNNVLINRESIRFFSVLGPLRAALQQHGWMDTSRDLHVSISFPQNLIRGSLSVHMGESVNLCQMGRHLASTLQLQLSTRRCMRMDVLHPDAQKGKAAAMERH